MALGLLVAIASSGCAAAGVTSDQPRQIGVLRSVPDNYHDAFLDELRQHGLHLGRDVAVRPADPEQVFGNVAEARETLLAWHEAAPLDLVIAFSTPYAELATDELPDVPSLFVVNDPVASGLVTDADAPDAGASGISFWTPADRTLHLAGRLVGGVERVGYLWPEDDPAVPGHRQSVLEAAAGLDVEVVEASFHSDDAASVRRAVEHVAADGVDAAWIASANATVRMLPELEASLDEHGLPAIANTEHAAFALLVVAPDGEQLRRQLARQAVRLLDGAPVESVPVEPPRRFVVIINHTKAGALGLPEIDAATLAQADLVR